METTVSIWPAIVWIVFASGATGYALAAYFLEEDHFPLYLGQMFFLIVMTGILALGNFFAPLGWGV